MSWKFGVLLQSRAWLPLHFVVFPLTELGGCIVPPPVMYSSSLLEVLLSCALCLVAVP